MLLWIVLIAIVLVFLLLVVRNPPGPITGPELGGIAIAENWLKLLLVLDVIVGVIVVIVRSLS